MQPWYRVVTLRKEVREGRSFSPDEFAALYPRGSEEERLLDAMLLAALR